MHSLFSGKQNVARSAQAFMTACLDLTGILSYKYMHEWWIHLTHVGVICSRSGNAGRFLSLLHGCDELIGVIAVETNRNPLCETDRGDRRYFPCKYISQLTFTVNGT